MLHRRFLAGFLIALLSTTAVWAQLGDGECLVPLDASQFEELLLDGGVIEPAEHAVAAPLMSGNIPVADGVITDGEYANACFYSFADRENPGNPWPGLDNVDDDEDLSLTMYLAHTDKSLFISFDVTDEFLDLEEGQLPFRNDGVELFLNSNQDATDPRGLGHSQIDADAAGDGDLEFNNRFTRDMPASFEAPAEPGEFYSAGIPKETGDGYILEYEIDLEALPTAEDEPMKTGDVLFFNFAVDDNDSEGAMQNGHHLLWYVDGDGSPFGAGQPSWNVPLQLTPGGPPPDKGDIDGDGDCDADDIDALAAAVRNGDTDARLDLNGDGSVNDADRIFLVEDSSLKNTFIGDSNLDGEFSSADFVAVFQAGEYEDAIAGNSGWAAGDWNGDGDFDSSDFVSAFQAGRYELGPNPAAAVPEPSALVLVTALACSLLAIRRRL